MSVWKKASKSNQKTHRERHQPEERKHLGLLEKKKDYVKRAKDYNEKQATLKLLRRKALNRNPDEFYHHMINSKVDNGIHHEKETEEADTPEQLKLMRSQDLKYITLKRTQEQKKIEKLQAELHLTSVDSVKKNKHIYFKNNLAFESDQRKAKEQIKEIPDFDLDELAHAVQLKKSLYKELAKRINRERELAIIQQKLEMKKHIESKKSAVPPKRIKKGTQDRAPVYLWKYERKK